MALFSQNQKATLNKNNLTYGSPIFTYKVPVINASAIKDYDFALDTTFQSANRTNPVPNWLPFDFMGIQNNSGVDMLIAINQDSNNTIYVPNGTIIRVTDVPIYSLRITNQNASSASTISLLQIVLQKLAPDTNSFARKLAGIFGI